MLCDEQEIPWQDIAFRSVDFALRRYLEDRRAGLEQHHFTTIDLRPPRRALSPFCSASRRLAEYAAAGPLPDGAASTDPGACR